MSNKPTEPSKPKTLMCQKANHLGCFGEVVHTGQGTKRCHCICHAQPSLEALERENAEWRDKAGRVAARATDEIDALRTQLADAEAAVDLYARNLAEAQDILRNAARAIRALSLLGDE